MPRSAMRPCHGCSPLLPCAILLGSLILIYRYTRFFAESIPVRFHWQSCCAYQARTNLVMLAAFARHPHSDSHPARHTGGRVLYATQCRIVRESHEFQSITHTSWPWIAQVVMPMCPRERAIRMSCHKAEESPSITRASFAALPQEFSKVEGCSESGAM